MSLSQPPITASKSRPCRPNSRRYSSRSSIIMSSGLPSWKRNWLASRRAHAIPRCPQAPNIRTPSRRATKRSPRKSGAVSPAIPNTSDRSFPPKNAARSSPSTQRRADDAPRNSKVKTPSPCVTKSGNFRSSSPRSRNTNSLASIVRAVAKPPAHHCPEAFPADSRGRGWWPSSAS